MYEETKEIIRLYNEGYWVDEISQQLGVGVEKIKMILVEKHLSVRPIPKSKAYREEFSEAWTRACRRFGK